MVEVQCVNMVKEEEDVKNVVEQKSVNMAGEEASGGCEICEHHRRRRTCRECGGSAICEHGRLKSQCRESNMQT